ncbi:MAG: hypothetical protein JNN15_17060 [Blastocatellia bacterium]|nr:hypothetical protein [Blastocatellia bacterium]
MKKAELLSLLEAASRREILQSDIAAEINARGIDFDVTNPTVIEFRKAGAKTIVIEAILRASERGGVGLPPDENTVYEDEQQYRERTLASLPMIEQARYHALKYSSELPNFIVRQRVSRFTRDPRTGRWTPRDTLDIEVTYENTKGETYRMIAINGKATKSRYEEVGGASSAGEFGSILLAIFNPSSKAKFKQGPEEKIGGRTATVFDFRVETENSSNQVTETRTGETVTSGYAGSVWIDQETKRVLRIEQAANDLPPDFPITVAESAVDYSWVSISGEMYLLPKKAELIIGSDVDRAYSRNVIEFIDYRKFETDIKIGTDD